MLLYCASEPLSQSWQRTIVVINHERLSIIPKLRLTAICDRGRGRVGKREIEFADLATTTNSKYRYLPLTAIVEKNDMPQVFSRKRHMGRQNSPTANFHIIMEIAYMARSIAQADLRW